MSLSLQASSFTATTPSDGCATKVAYIMSRFPKITETFILYEMLEQERLGMRIEIYPLLRERQAVAHPEVEALVERAHFHPFCSLPILRANWHFIRHRPAAYFKMLVEVLRGTFGSANFFIGAIGILLKAVRFAYEMQQQGIAHVHAHFATHPAIAALIVHRLTGIPFSFTAHGSDLHVERRMLDKKVAAAAFAVTISSYNKEVMVRECGEIARDKIYVIHCGIDSEVFLPHYQKKSGRPFQILCVGSLEEVKGHQYLIEACRMLSAHGVDWECHLVGDGPLRRQIEKQIAEACLEDKIILHGSRTRAQVAQMMQTADVFVLASVPTAQGKREGIPVVLMEAMATGLPVVSSRLSGIPELVESERTGILVPPRDAAALAEALKRLSAVPALRFRMGQSGREKVLKEFNLKTNTATLTELIRQVAKTPRAEQMAVYANPRQTFLPAVAIPQARV